MIVVSIKFKGRGKTYYFDPNGLTVPEGAQVVVETSKGLELAVCVKGNHEVTDARIVPPLRPVVRIATPDDLRVAELCKTREKEAFAIAERKIAEHGLDMKLVDVECNFEGTKILFFFTSEGRVDFRELVKDLAGVFRTRIELRQIGVRDEAKMLGGIGICGQPYCCHRFMDEFQPVSTKMAKTQSLSLNPAKISGSCGRLMCCLRYEQEAYEELVKSVPKNGAFVETTAGYGSVAQVNLLRQCVKVRLDEDASIRSFEADEVAAVPGGRPRPGEPLPHVLKAVPKRKPEPEEPQENAWIMPAFFAEDTAAAADGPAAAESADSAEAGEKRGRKRRGKRGKRDDGTMRESAERGGERRNAEAEPDRRPAQKKADAERKQGQKTQKPAPDGAEAEAQSGDRRRGKKRRSQRQPGEKAEGAERSEKPDRAEKPDRGEKPERGEKADGSARKPRREHRPHKAPDAAKPNAPAPAGGGNGGNGENPEKHSARRRHRKPKPPAE